MTPLNQRPQLGVQALFFTYFGFVGIFSPYLSLYFADVGMTVTQIGVLMSLPQILRIVAPPFWGWLADHVFSRLTILRFSAVLTLLLVAGFPWVAGHGYWALMAYMVCLFFMTAAQGPINEAMAVGLAAGDSGRYGRMRLWGSIGFIVSVTGMGPLLDWGGLKTLPYWMSFGAVGLVWASFGNWNRPSPVDPSLHAATPVNGQDSVATSRSLFLPGDLTSSQASLGVRRKLAEPAIALFFLANGLMVFAHAALYVLFSLYLEAEGYTKTEVGLIWAISVVAEILLFRYQQWIFARYSAIALLVLSMAVAFLRFGLVGLLAPSVALLVLTQLSHAITFGLHHSAAMNLLHRWFAPNEQARAQAIYIVCSYGIGGSLGGLVCSQLWVRFSPGVAFLGASVGAALGTLAALASWRAVKRKI